jgi:hypothetical protein
VIQKHGGAECDAEVDVLWDGRRRHYTYSYVETHLPEGRLETRDGAQLLYTGQDMFWHTPGAGPHGLAGEVPKVRHKQRRGIWEICPSEVWFRQKDTGLQWADEFDATKYPETLREIEITTDGDLITVRKTYETIERVIVASLSQGGNIVKYWRTGDPNVPKGRWGYGERVTFEWEPDSRGEFALKKHRLEHLPATGVGDPVYVYELVITSFDPEPEISPNRFDFAALNLPAGTYMKHADGRRYRIEAGPGGDTGKGLSQQVLDDLAEQVGRDGFGKPGPGAQE